MNEFKGTKGEWYSAFTAKRERGVRTKGGYICFLPKPNHYSGQDDRYERELEENKANAKLIAAAPKMLEALIKISKEVDPDKSIHVSSIIEQLAKEAINEAI
jgi:hypothetical protein